MKTSLKQIVFLIALLSASVSYCQTLQLQNSLVVKKSKLVTKQPVRSLSATKKEIISNSYTDISVPDTKPQRLKLQGKIFDAASNSSIPGAKIFIKEYNISVVSDFDGTFTTETPVFGALTVLITFPGMQQLIINTEDSEGKDINIGKVFLKPSQTVVYTD